LGGRKERYYAGTFCGRCTLGRKESRGVGFWGWESIHGKRVKGRGGGGGGGGGGGKPLSFFGKE